MKKRLLPPIFCLLCLPLYGQAENVLIKLSPEQIKSLSITTQSLNRFEAGGGRRLPAQVVVPPRQVEVIGAPLAGAVTAVLAAYGETVTRGQPLARMQGPQMLELQRDYLQAQAQAEVASESRRRDEALHADGIIAGSRLSVTRATERQAAAQLAEKRQALHLAGLSAPGTEVKGLSGVAEIRAPFAGVVLEAAVQPGQRVETSTLLFKLGRIDSLLWLEIQATPAQAAGLAPGDKVSVVGCAQGSQDGRLTLIAPHMNPATQSLLLRAELPKPDACVKPFQFVQVNITPAAPQTGNRSGNTWRVPGSALVRYQGKVWLFAAVAGGFRPIPVNVLDETEKSSLVVVEMPGDARIVTHGVVTLKASWLGLGAGQAK
ncbi:MAG: HlyD family efflux transporter periplasmic adaptor subunit [Rugosibacter sp.]|nr:MAG: HlyD family efflux transporter periplasmic adaptor subunit [Rugosibacter sp.]